MERLTVIGIEDDTLVVETPSGARYGVAIDDLPRRRPRHDAEPVQRKASPREIQTLIRQGMTSREVHERTGEDLAYIERFEGPVLAERQHILELAKSTPVASGDIDPLAGERTFDEAMRERLAELEAHDIEWLSWREAERGWVIRLTFSAEGRQADARWTFDRKKRALTPLGKEAKALSQNADPGNILVPRLRSVEPQQVPAEQETPSDDQQEKSSAREAATATEGQPLGGKRFDSGAFRFSKQDVESAQKAPSAPTVPGPESARKAAARSSGAATEPSHTADLLDALRRRRAERENASGVAESESAAPEQHGEEEDTPLFQVEQTPEVSADEDQGKHHTSPLSAGKRKSSRAAMPSWDEIVFGSRTDD